MSTQDLIAIATFAIAILSVVYAFGQRDSKLTTLEKDLNSLGLKLHNHCVTNENEFTKIDSRIDKLNNFYVRVDQRVLQLQEECFGEKKTDRLRESDHDEHYTTINETWYSENSGIDM